MSMYGKYRIFAGEVNPDRSIDAQLENLDNKHHVIRIRFGRDFGPIVIGGELEILGESSTLLEGKR